MAQFFLRHGVYTRKTKWYLEDGECKEFRRPRDAASDRDRSSISTSQQVNRLDTVSEVIDPVQAFINQVHAQTQRLIKTFTDED